MTGDTNSAATLSLEISTRDAVTNLNTLSEAYGRLHQHMQTGLDLPGQKKLDADLKDLKVTMGSVAAAMDALTKRAGTSAQGLSSAYSQSLGGYSISMKTAVADTKAGSDLIISQMTRVATATRDLAVKQVPLGFKVDRNLGALGALEGDAKKVFEASAQYSRAWADAHVADLTRTLAAEVRHGEAMAAAVEQRNKLIQQFDTERYLAAGVAAARLKAIQESRDKETYDQEVAKYARRNELIEKLDYELYVARSAASARLKALQEARDTETYQATAAAAERQLALERKYILASEAQRLKAAIDARKLMDAGYRGNLASEFAPSTIAMASGASLRALEAEYIKLIGATNSSASAQHRWNELAHQGSGAARGLAGSLGGLWLTYGSLVPLLATAALASSMKSVITVGKDLEYQFTYIQAITEGTVVSLNELGDAIKGTIFTPVEAAGALRVLAQAGLEVDQAMSALPSVLKLATVGEVDVAGAALTATSVMHTFGLAVSDISHIGDVFATAARLSATSVGEMMGAMKQASSVANIFGVTVEETAAALATLANRGIEGSAAGTAIRNMVKELASPASKRAAEALKQYGIEIFNADGSVKTFTSNLKELSHVTSVMSAQTKARFLEDLFNERGAKAANILLSDLEKMEKTLKEIEMSSKGLGFMTEAQVRIAQSLDGMMKAAKSGLQVTFAEVYKSIRPDIEGIVDSFSKLASSEGLKTTLTAIAKGFISLTEALREHGTVIGTVIAAYAGFVVVKTVGTILTTMSVAAWGATAAVTGLSGALAGLATVGKSGGAVAVMARLAALLNGPLQIGLAAVSVAAGIYALKMRTSHDTIDELIGTTKDLVDAQKRLNDSMEAGVSGLAATNKLQAERIRLLREGKTAADAAAQASDNLGYAQAKEAARTARESANKALANLSSPKFADEGDRASRGEAPSDAYVKAQAQYTEAVALVKTATGELERAATGSIRAGMLGRDKALGDIVEKAHAEVRVQNAKFEQIKEIARLAQQEIDSGAKISDDRRKRLDKDVARGAGAEKFAPLDPKTAESDATKVELRRREDFIAEHDPGYVKYEAPARTGSNRGEQKDLRSIANDNLSSALKREQIQLATELGAVEVQLAAQTISAAVAQERKNAAAITELETEGKIIAQYLSAARAAGDKVQISKFSNDLAENGLKLDEQRQKAALNLVQVHTADRNAIEDISRASTNYAQDLQFEIELMGKTALEAATLRIEYERLRATQALNVRAERNQDNPEVIAAMREEIAAKAEAQKADAEYQESYAGGWAKAYDAYTKSATSAAKQAQSAFQVMTSAMEDALDSFLTTGKINFADFAKGLILEMAKIEGKALLAKMNLSAGGDSGGGFGSVVKSLLGGIMSMFGGGASASTTAVQSAGGVANSTPWAKGGAFIGSPSLHQYVNTVQTTPRMFEYQNLHGFAKGGVFAEAGPEAVMPIMASELGRDAKGRLGIKRNSGDTYNLKVVVMGNQSAPDVRRSAGQGAREALAAFKGVQRFG